MTDRPADAYRTPDEVRRQGNHLQDQDSLYLRQHAHNPVDWYPWGEKALARARNENRPIFLSSGYAACHWCHVMEKEVFDQDEVAEFLNRHFICIKVDREERPDLDAVFIAAVQAITGRGGWPLSVFLTPDQKPFFGGTYFPRDQFGELIRKIHQIYPEKREEIDEQAGLLAERVVALPDLVDLPAREGAPVIGADILEGAAVQATVNLDRKWAGFKGEQKFPTPVRWRFLLDYARSRGERRYAHLVEITLEAMASGGIYDHVGGGFHRYSVDRMWQIPHFEKMLYDNAQLASLYLEAGVALDREDFVVVGQGILDFLLQEMQDSGGAFAGSIDADSEGAEGRFYVWTPAEITEATDAADGPVLAELLRVGVPGNFEADRDTSVLTRRTDLQEVAAKFDRDPVDIAALFQTHRQKLLDYRARREAPRLDRKIVTAWNGLTISALAHGFAVTGDERYLQAAEKAAAFLWRVHRREDGGLYRASNEGRPVGEAILDDYALLAVGLLDLFQVTGEAEFLDRALELVDRARADFAREKGGFFQTPAGAEAPLGRKVDYLDSVTPSGNAALLQALVRAAILTGKAEYRQDAESCLAAFGGLISKVLLEMSWWLDAAVKLNGPLYEVVIAADPGTELAGAVLRTLPSNAVVIQVPADGPDPAVADLVPSVAGKQAASGEATAFVCEAGVCREPTSDPLEVLAKIGTTWAE